MTPGFLLVILTMMAGGDMSAAFVNTETLENCNDRGEVVRTILSNGKVDIRTITCFRSDIKFKKFSHKETEGAPRYRYVISLKNKNVAITLTEDEKACHATARKDEVVFCATSSQLLLK